MLGECRLAEMGGRGLCSIYDNYFFCLAEEEIPVSHYYLSNFKKYYKRIEVVIDQAIQISY